MGIRLSAGEIDSFGRRLGQLFGKIPRGMWLPERIWEPALAADLASAGIEHTVLDDFHFHSAGLSDAQLRGYYLSEAEGRLIAIFPGDAPYEPIVFRVEHYAAGIATIPAAALQEALRTAATRLLVGTSSHCHAAVGALQAPLRGKLPDGP